MGEQFEQSLNESGDGLKTSSYVKNGRWVTEVLPEMRKVILEQRDISLNPGQRRQFSLPEIDTSKYTHVAGIVLTNSRHSFDVFLVPRINNPSMNTYELDELVLSSDVAHRLQKIPAHPLASNTNRIAITNNDEETHTYDFVIFGLNMESEKQPDKEYIDVALRKVLQPNEIYFYNAYIPNAETKVMATWSSGVNDFRITLTPMSSDFVDELGNRNHHYFEGVEIGSVNIGNESSYYRVEVRNDSSTSRRLMRLAFKSVGGGAISAVDAVSGERTSLSTVKDSNERDILRVVDAAPNAFYSEYGDRGSYGVNIVNMPNNFGISATQREMVSLRGIVVPPGELIQLTPSEISKFRRAYLVFRSDRDFNGKIYVDDRLSNPTFGALITRREIVDTTSAPKREFISKEFLLNGPEFVVRAENEDAEDITMDISLVGVPGGGELIE